MDAKVNPTHRRWDAGTVVLVSTREGRMLGVVVGTRTDDGWTEVEWEHTHHVSCCDPAWLVDAQEFLSGTVVP